MKNNYDEILNKYSSDKGTSAADLGIFSLGYGEIYEKIFENYRETALHICDIGIERGASIKANEEFFINATIHGVDIDAKTQFDNDRIKTYIVDQGNLQDLRAFSDRMKSEGVKFDIICDDGSHDVMHQQLTFGVLFDLLKPGGLYIIEDLCSSYFDIGTQVYSYEQTPEKLQYNTISFLTNRPYYSPWIEEKILNRLGTQIETITTFERNNKDLPYRHAYKTVDSIGARIITSIIKKAKKETIDSSAVTIRKYQDSDKNDVLSCLQEVWRISEISDDTLVSFLASDNHLYVALHENEIVGCATLHLQKKLIRNGGIAGFVEEVVIKEKFRGKGIGETLINTITKDAEELGCYKVTLCCFPERIAFYEKCGFKQENVTMRKSIQ